MDQAMRYGIVPAIRMGRLRRLLGIKTVQLPNDIIFLGRIADNYSDFEILMLPDQRPGREGKQIDCLVYVGDDTEKFG